MRLSLNMCAALLLCVCALCAVAAEPPARIDYRDFNNGKVAIIGALGVPLGKVVEVEATVVSGGALNTKAATGTYLLRVEAIDRTKCAEGLLLHFRLAPGANAPLANDGFSLHELRTGEKAGTLDEATVKKLEAGYVGSRHRLLVYEIGFFDGIPDNMPKDVLTWQDTGFGFKTQLLVVGEKTHETSVAPVTAEARPVSPPAPEFSQAASPVSPAAVLMPASRATIVPNMLFSDHAVLQQGREIPVWGTAREGERVTVEIAGQKVATTTKDGRWLVRLRSLPAGGPHTMTISGGNTVTISDLLVGEVWICSGQSNMERQLGPREGQQPIVNWEQEAAAANYPQIRQFLVPQKPALTPATAVEGKWVVCSPQTVADFTAVGYFFGRDLQQAQRVPIGLIHSSWGGTPAESWTSLDTLTTLPDFKEAASQVEQARIELANGTYNYLRTLENWYRSNDTGSATTAPWSAPDLDGAGWTPTTLPAFWEDTGLPGFDGVVWFRKTFDLPAPWAGADAELHLGAIDDADTTWVNGVQVGATSGWRVPRVYHVSAAALRPGRNVIAVRVLDTGGNGGIWGDGHPLQLAPAPGRADTPIPLEGEWLRKVSVRLGPVPYPPSDYHNSPMVPGALYNGIIAPLQRYAIRGVIWYQGEANVGRERQYRTLFPALIADWRRAWGEGDFPFLFVQIAPHKDMTPEIREAQLFTSQHTPNTAMAVTIDCGDANDIHPAHKQPVGARLALAARALAYGEHIEFSGPVFASLQIEGGRAVLRFTHLGGGLVAKDGPLTGFTIAGADQVVHPATAAISGDTIVVSSDAVPQPVAVRYGWANVPEGNSFNTAGLPASPFRTDVD